MNQKTKQIILIIVIIVISFIGYKVYFVDSESTNEALTAERTSASEFAEGQVILSLLNRLKDVKLDESVFSDEVFNRLVNFERPIENQIMGRPNPFLPIGR